MRLDKDQLIRWSLGVAAAASLSVCSGLALAHFTVQGTSDYYLPRAPEVAESDPPPALDREKPALLQLLPNADSISRRGDALVTQARYDAPAD